MPCIIGTAGHIDHGKTALVKALTGMDTDTLAEEKTRGVSIDLGFAYLDIGGAGGANERYAIVDVPGHEKFIKNMLAGVSGIDMVLFCVAADDGVMPQTIEHLDIVRLLGVTNGIFVITKKDIVDPERCEEVKKEVAGLIGSTRLKGSPIVSVSASGGEGIDELKALIVKVCSGPGRVHSPGFFRVPADRSFSIKGFGAVVTGTVASGSAKAGDEVYLFPSGDKLRIRGLESHHEKLESVGPGQRVAVNLTGASHNTVTRGDVVTSPDFSGFVSGIKGSMRVDCVFEFTGHDFGAGGTLPAIGTRKEVKKAGTVKSGARLMLHHLTSSSPVSVRFAGGKEAAPTRPAHQGGRLYGRLFVRKPVLLLRGDRFILRDPSTRGTVGGGTVLMPYYSRRLMPVMNDAPYETLEKAEAGGVLPALLKGKGSDISADRKTVGLMLNVPDADLPGVLGKAGFEVTGSEVVSLDRVAVFKGRVMEVLKSYHGAHPSDSGMKEEALSSAAGINTAGVFKRIIDGLLGEGLIKMEGRLFAAASHQRAPGGVDEAIVTAIRGLVPRGLKPATDEELKKLPFERKDLDRVLALMVKAGEVVRIRQGSYLSGEAAAGAREKLEGFLKEGGRIKAAEFRDLLGCGRKLAIEILEYFDRERVTLRQGDFRTLR